MEVRIYGASDDLVEFDGDFIEEYSVGFNKFAEFSIGGQFKVRAEYGKNGSSWMIGLVGDDGDVFPEGWKAEYIVNEENNYSPMLRITAPTNFKVMELMVRS